MERLAARAEPVVRAGVGPVTKPSRETEMSATHGRHGGGVLLQLSIVA